MPDVDALIKKIQQCVPRIEQHSHGPVPDPTPCLSYDELVDCETRLGFAIPALLARIYQEIGNGGFGPGYGLIGIGPNGFSDDLEACVDSRYLEDTRVIPGVRSLGWPKRLLVLSHHGCGMYTCVDADTDQMIYWEPNYWVDGKPARTALYPMGMTLFQWFERWVDEENPFELEHDKETSRPTIPSMYDLDPPQKRKRGYPRAQLNLFDEL